MYSRTALLPREKALVGTSCDKKHKTHNCIMWLEIFLRSKYHLAVNVTLETLILNTLENKISRYAK